MDQATFLFDNQYDPFVIDQVYHEIRETMWSHCIAMQQAMTRQKVLSGPITDFKWDPALNAKKGFPHSAYTLFVSESVMTNQLKYILGKFIKKKETITLKEILTNDKFHNQLLLQLGEYVYMDAQISLVSNGFYLVIPIGTETGITADTWNGLLTNFGSAEYFPNRWTLIQRPKTSFGYGKTTPLAAINGTRIYLSSLKTRKSYITEEIIDDWKVCISDNAQNLSLLRMSIGNLKYDETDGRPYIEISDAFSNYITSTMGQINIFVYNEDRKVGMAVSPNYIGPTNYLYTVFSEILASIEGRRFKVMVEHPEGGWVNLAGFDTKFGNDVENLVSVGFDISGMCWVSIPTKDGVCPINPHNFRVWEYDAETDTLGRLVCTNVTPKFPNLYEYIAHTDSNMLYIEWFRDDVNVGTDYLDFTKDYRDYIGVDFPTKLVNGEVAASISNFLPITSEFDESDFIKKVLLYSTHEYRVEKMIEVLKETGMEYDRLYNALDAKFAPFFTEIYDMTKLPNAYASIVSNGYLRVNRPLDKLGFDVYINGMHDGQTSWGRTANGDTYITFDTSKVDADSLIIIDYYWSEEVVSAKVDVNDSFEQSRIYEFPLEMISGSDIVVAAPSGQRFSSSAIEYGINSKELLVQVPETFVDWEGLGITINDPRLTNRVGVSTDPNQSFKSVVFRLLMADHDSLAFLKSIESEDAAFVTSDGKYVLVRHAKIIVTTEDYGSRIIGTAKFSKKVHATDIALRVYSGLLPPVVEELWTNTEAVLQDENDYTLATNKYGGSGIITNTDTSGDGTISTASPPYSGTVTVYNATTYRKTDAIDLGVSINAIFSNYYGADDPTRILSFVNGVLQSDNGISGTIPALIGDDFVVKFTGYYSTGMIGQCVYLPFPVDRFTFTSDAYGQANLAGSGIMTIGANDIIFEDGYRIPNEAITRVTNQLVKTPSANATYTVIRYHRDSNLYAFDDITTQSFMDKLFQDSPGYRQHCGLY